MKNNFQNFPTHYSNDMKDLKDLKDFKDLNDLQSLQSSKTPFIREVERCAMPLLDMAVADSGQLSMLCVAKDNRPDPTMACNTAMLTSGNVTDLAKLLMELSRDEKMQPVFDTFFRMYVDAHGL